MFGERHDIPHEFPEYIDYIGELRSKDPVFDAIYKEYDALDREILKIEQNLEPVSDFYAEDLKKKRVLLKDEIYAVLRKKADS
jgi:uncharacterized protein YdcH (DUF465 family)